MPRGRTAKQKKKTLKSSTSKARSTGKTVVSRLTKDKDPKSRSRPKRVTAGRPGLRSEKSSLHAVLDPNEILRKANKERKEAKAAATAGAGAGSGRVSKLSDLEPSRDQSSRHIAQSIEVAIERLSRLVDDKVTVGEISGTEESGAPDENEEFNRSWGYLPPLDDEATAIIEAIIANPNMAAESMRLNPSHDGFPRGLQHRNVRLVESRMPDPYVHKLRLLKPSVHIDESAAETESHGQLWEWDQAKANEGSNEALFHRTIMMQLIGRHLLIYKRRDSKPSGLDFSVEEVWSCHPMPTRAYAQRTKFLSRPKPDLAVHFQRETVIPDDIWLSLPIATQELACFEGVSWPALNRAFHFLTIEAKKQQTSVADKIGRFQSLNNASQALHNMFEFFRDAGTEYETAFFAKVRFFSAVCSTEGLVIRVHRAVRLGANGPYIMPQRKDYPLSFEYQEYAKISKAEFEREKVLKIMENILHGYGLGVLFDLIHSAARVLSEKLAADPEAYEARGSPDFYRYGQTVTKTKSGIQTPVSSRPLSITPRASTTQAANPDFSQTTQTMSFEMAGTGTSTPVQTQSLASEIPEPARRKKGKGKKRQKSASPKNTSASSRQGSKRTYNQSFSSAMST